VLGTSKESRHEAGLEEVVHLAEEALQTERHMMIRYKGRACKICWVFEPDQ
jgi:hypothetical protein